MACGKPEDDPDFNVFAKEIEDAIERRDGSFFGRRSDTSVVSCPNIVLPICNSLKDGREVRVFPVRTAFDGTVIPIADYIGLLTYWTASADASLQDAYGSGEAVLYALARSRPAPEAPEEMHAIVTAITTPPWGDGLRAARVITWRYGEDDRWHVMYDSLYDSVSAMTLETWLTGSCGDCYEEWRRWERSH